jgi:hypothetical protein
MMGRDSATLTMKMNAVSTAATRAIGRTCPTAQARFKPSMKNQIPTIRDVCHAIRISSHPRSSPFTFACYVPQGAPAHPRDGHASHNQPHSEEEAHVRIAQPSRARRLVILVGVAVASVLAKERR